MFPSYVSVKLTKSKVVGGQGGELILWGGFAIPTCSFRWSEGQGKTAGGTLMSVLEHLVSIRHLVLKAK